MAHPAATKRITWKKVPGFSRAQVTRLVRQHRQTGNIRDHRRKAPANAFPTPLHTPHDAALLAEVDRFIGSWIDFYNDMRPNSSLGGRTPGETYRNGARAA